MSPPPRSEAAEPRPPSGTADDSGDHLTAEAVLDAAEQAALARRAHLREAFDELVAASTNANVDDEHDPEGTTIAFERSQLDAHLRRVEGDLAELDAARERLAQGRYGRCERCGGPIPLDRLAARPTARTCVSCPSR